MKTKREREYKFLNFTPYHKFYEKNNLYIYIYKTRSLHDSTIKLVKKGKKQTEWKTRQEKSKKKKENKKSLKNVFRSKKKIEYEIFKNTKITRSNLLHWRLRVLSKNIIWFIENFPVFPEKYSTWKSKIFRFRIQKLCKFFQLFSSNECRVTSTSDNEISTSKNI